MKRKIVSILLCFVMLASCILPNTSSVFAESKSETAVYKNDQTVTEVAVPSNKTVDINVDENDAYDLQWQINIPNSKTWANIYNETSEKLTVSHALVANVLNNNDIAYVRCAITPNSEGELYYSDTVAISIAEAEYEMTESTNLLSRASLRSTLKSNESVTIRINYCFEDGTEAAQSWVGTFVKGSSYSLDVESPEVKGYVAKTTRIQKDFESLDEDVTYTVEYEPTKVKYIVRHFQQNVACDDYDEVVADRVEHTDKYANEPVGDGHANTYTGFKPLDYDTTMAIAADGSTKLNIYYDRLYYLMIFDLQGGYGVEPIYAPYGAEIPSNLNPKKAGYSFVKWDRAIPSTMPAENQTFTAEWYAGAENVNVNVAFWYENANDSNYTFVGSAVKQVTFTDGKTVKPSDFKDENFTGRDDYHFNFNANKNTAVELKADGTTIVNVYFTRKTYKMIFFNCRQSGHVSDEASCYPSTREEALNLVKGFSDRVDVQLDPSGAKIWGISIYTRKWQQDVSADWKKGIANRSNTRRWMPYKTYGETGNVIYDGTLNVSMMNIMPDADVVFWFKSTGEVECTMNYWVTPVTGTSTSGQTTKTDNGITYIQHNKYTTMMGGITENEEYVDIEGFTKVYTWVQLASKGYRTSGDGWATAHFFYKRNSYNLAYISEGSTVRTVKVEYEGAINGVDKNNKNYTPPYPSNFEPDAYVFKGWYLSQDCIAGTEVDWNAKMPVGGMSVYAKWEPVIHDVTVKVSIDAASGTKYTVTHGKTVENPPEDPTKEGYSFISWFYTDENGVEKPFTFEMPVYSDLVLYPKWKQEAIVDGTISYKLENGTKISDDSKVSALVGNTKTFDAKGSDELYEAYETGYFPLTTSHNITFDIDKAKNVYTFTYVYKEKVPYTVRYLEEGTGKELASAKNATSDKAAIVENFKPIAGYLPDLYKKPLILSAEGENVLTFWYKKDAEHAPVLRGHYLENANDDDYTTYQEVLDGYGKIGKEYSEAPLNNFTGTDINGFTLNTYKSKQIGVLTNEGLELKLYYDRNLYPYEFKFVDENGKEIAKSITGTAKFEATVKQDALDIPGYALIEGEPSTKEIKEISIESDSDNAEKNVRTFTYKAVYADLKITKTGYESCDANQTFVFEVSGDPDDKALESIKMTVTIKGNDSVLIESLPVGTYKIEEVSEWSWRYTTSGTFANRVVLNNPQETKETIISNSRTNGYWLSGDSYCENVWSGENGSIVSDKSN